MPDGNGHRVRYLGAGHEGLPTAIYRSVDPAGQVWRVAVTYVSEHGEMATSVTEVVWRWLQNPASTWTMVQRISPWEMHPSGHLAWDTAVVKALDLPTPSSAFPVLDPANQNLEEIEP